jgi:O-acetyl-ADP-ribose deacetylase (regulator of RNase III)
MIRYLQGDATNPAAVAVGSSRFVIAHVVNDCGGWGRGFVVSLSKRYAAPEQAYRDLAKSGGLTLGDVQFVDCGTRTTVANMIAQEAYSKPGQPAIRYDALETCLNKVHEYAIDLGASVHMPRIGCGLAGGKWSEIEPILERALEGIDVYVYDFVSNDRSVMIDWNK